MSREVAGSSPAASAGKLYIVGRSDLAPGLRVAQMFHAAREFACRHPYVEGRWFAESNTIVLLEVPDRAAMEALVERARSAGVTMADFAEPDFLDVGTTAVALGPDARRLVSSLPLALKASETGAT
jgi:peptidyl-tRNA hydrolase